MSRIGKKPIPVPAGVKVNVTAGQVNVEGPKGKLDFTPHKLMKVCLDESAKSIMVHRDSEDRLSRSLHGLTRTLLANMIEGVTKGYEKKMELYGVGFSVSLQANKFSMVCGYSHPMTFVVPAGVTVEVSTAQARSDTEPARFTIRGCDKQAVGEFAAQCRRARKPEPYKGKGVRYVGEHIVRKVGKAFAGAGGG